MLPLLLLVTFVVFGATEVTPPGFSCVFHRREEVVCEIQTANKTIYNCTVCSYSGLKNKQCSDQKSRKTSCISNIGICKFFCKKKYWCRETHWILFDIFNSSTNEIDTSCEVIDTRKLIKPDPVQRLTLNPINSTAVKVKFGKPDKPGNADLYKYIVKYISNITLSAKQRKVSKRSDHQVEVTLTDLEPGTNYTILIFARPERKGFRSVPVTTWTETLQDVPSAGPVVPEGSFAVSNNQIAIYWKEVPTAKRSGWIQRYNVSVKQCDYDTILSRDQFWTVVNRSSCSQGPFEVQTLAATSVGWSKKPSVFHIDPHLYKTHHVESLQKENQKLTWSFPNSKRIDSFSIFSCYGNQDTYQPQLVVCKVPIENVTVSAHNRSVSLPVREAPPVVCNLCDWHYGVSVNVKTFGAGIRWAAPIEPIGEVVENHLATRVIIAVVLVSVLAVLFCVGMLICCVTTRRDTFCKRIIIILPKMLADDSYDTEITSSSQITNSSKVINQDKATVPFLRDSGNSSMTTIRIDTEEAKRAAVLEEEEGGEGDSGSAGDDDDREETSHEDEEFDTSGMSDYRQVACSQEASADVPVMYSDFGSTFSTSGTSAEEYNMCVSPLESSASTGESNAKPHWSSALKDESSASRNMSDQTSTNTSDDSIDNTSSGSLSRLRPLGPKCASVAKTPEKMLHSDISMDNNEAVSWDVKNMSSHDKVPKGACGKINHKDNEDSTATSIGSYAEFYCDPV